jgi:hypothetical protein
MSDLLRSRDLARAKKTTTTTKQRVIKCKRTKTFEIIIRSSDL